VPDLTSSLPFHVASLPNLPGSCRLEALPQSRILSVAPYPGREDEAARRLGAFPAPGEVHVLGAARLVWAGRGMAFLLNPAEGQGDGLAGIAAVTDQSDGWAGLRLSGPDAEEVLARLVPLDLAPMTPPASVRSLLNHMPLLLIRGDEGFEVWSYRSMAGTLLHELATAMRGVAARRKAAAGS
jgi:sarcosine oxidase subunit gamma